MKVGDRVCLPFNISCGFCRIARTADGFLPDRQSRPGMAGAAYGFAGMGPYNGGQAEYLRVPFGDSNCLKLPDDAQEKENDYVMLSDIFPTGWHATELAGVQPGDSVVVYGVGPVGLMAAYSATIKGASQGHDRRPPPRPAASWPNRSASSRSTTPKDRRSSRSSSIPTARAPTAGCDCVGYQCHDPAGP